MKKINNYILEKLKINKDSGSKISPEWYKFSSTYYQDDMLEFNNYTRKEESKNKNTKYIFFLTRSQILEFKERYYKGPETDGKYRLQVLTYSDNLEKTIKWYFKIPSNKTREKFWPYAKEIKITEV